MVFVHERSDNSVEYRYILSATLNGIQKVVGSIPSSSTIDYLEIPPT